MLNFLIAVLLICCFVCAFFEANIYNLPGFWLVMERKEDEKTVWDLTIPFLYLKPLSNLKIKQLSISLRCE